MINENEIHIDTKTGNSKPIKQGATDRIKAKFKIIEVKVFNNGREIDRIHRPVKEHDGKFSVKYKGNFYILQEGNKIYLPISDNNPNHAGVNNQKEASLDTNVISQIGMPREAGLDECQKDVVQAPPHARLLVSAGPGTGKTEVACARLANLIDNYQIAPSSIWFISFTRTAVGEIRERISSHLHDPGDVFLVKIATLDSHAWMIQSGFDENAKILGSYDENIKNVLELISNNEMAIEYLQSVRHLIVDEAQDFVGIRSNLVLTFIEKLSAECGVTIFADEAQAIYGFSEIDEGDSCFTRRKSLPALLRDDRRLGFVEKGLERVHRTESSRLLTLFTKTRLKVLTCKDTEQKDLDEVIEEVKKLAHETVPSVQRQDFNGLEDLFILYRRRADVLLASSFLGCEPHRIRMSGLPLSVAPWVGCVLSEYTEATLDQNTFVALWSSSNVECLPNSPEMEDAWKDLLRLAGRTSKAIDMAQLRTKLGRKQPPPEMCSTEIGQTGPIIGTIHAVKGREAKVVHLMLPSYTTDARGRDEEARVVYVGATRGRLKLKVGQGYKQWARHLEPSGRVFSPKFSGAKPKAQVEIGHEFDIEPAGLAGRSVFANETEVRESQRLMKSSIGHLLPVEAEQDRTIRYIYRLRIDGQSTSIGTLSKVVNDDLFEIGRLIHQKIGGAKLRPPDIIRHLRMFGVRTIVLPPEATECALLHEPWAKSGILLAPIILGYTTMYFQRYRRRRRG